LNIFNVGFLGSTVLAGDFNPESVSGLIAWYDANDVTTIDKDGSDLVSEWRNKVVDDAFTVTQATAGNKPTWVLEGQNGKDTIRYAAQDFLQSGAFTDVDQPLTIFWASKIPTASASNIREFMRNVSGTTIQIGVNDGTDDKILSQMDSDSMLTGSIIGIEETWRQIKLLMNGASSSIFVDGVSQATGSQGTKKFEQFNFSSADSQGSWVGDFGEVLIYDEVVSAADITDIEVYLQAKWATPALP
tara:strand:- start:42 stop:776 length:735 start_codon:yes stop_codon:yes gene_type:complete